MTPSTPPPPWSRPMPPPRPAPKKSQVGTFVAIGMFGSLLALSAGLFAWAMLRARTPEGQAALLAAQGRDLRAVSDAVAMLTDLSKALPTNESESTACPADVNVTFLTPVVDSEYLRELAGEAPANARGHALASLRSMVFTDKLITAAGAIRSGAPRESGFAAKESLQIMEAEPLVVLAIDELSAPEVDGSSFTGGELVGQVVVFDRKAKRIACHAPISAASSGSIKTGGGVRFKVKGLPLPTVGGSGSLAEAIEKDFKKNVDAAIDRALDSIGARKR